MAVGDESQAPPQECRIATVAENRGGPCNEITKVPELRELVSADPFRAALNFSKLKLLSG